MEYISRRWYDIPELVVPIRIFVRGLLLTRKSLNQGFFLVKLKSSLRKFYYWPLWNICVTNDHGYVPLVVNTSRSFPHSQLITEFVTRLTRPVPVVEQELPTLPEHLSSPPVCSGVCVTRSLVLYVCHVDRCLSFFFWPLCCLFFFDVRILIAPLISSNSSYRIVLYRVQHLVMSVGLELTPFVVIGTDFISSCNCNYNDTWLVIYFRIYFSTLNI
jgi:hypothetical protein